MLIFCSYPSIKFSQLTFSLLNLFRIIRSPVNKKTLNPEEIVQNELSRSYDLTPTWSNSFDTSVYQSISLSNSDSRDLCSPPRPLLYLPNSRLLKSRISATLTSCALQCLTIVGKMCMSASSIDIL